ncbi:hypothetical protein MASR2M8_13450 [Opitutaceae bacterium]
MIDLIKKTLLAGVGAAMVTKDKAEQALQDFVKQGKVSAADARAMAERIAEQGRKEFDEMSGQLSDRIREYSARADAATLTRIAALEQRVQALESRAASPDPSSPAQS